MAKKKKKQTTVKHSVVWGIVPSGFKRMAFSYKGKTVTLKVNPDTYKYTRGQRSATYKTQNANVNQQFGAELAEISIQGNTGWHKDGKGLDGKDRLDELNKLIADYQNDTQNGGHSASPLKFDNYTDHKYYTVTVAADGFQYSRDKENPLVYDYLINLTVLGGSDTPKQDSSLVSDIGTGSGSSIDKGQDATSPVSTTDAHLMDTLLDSHATQQDIDKATDALKKGHGK